MEGRSSPRGVNHCSPIRAGVEVYQWARAAVGSYARACAGSRHGYLLISLAGTHGSPATQAQGFYDVLAREGEAGTPLSSGQ